MILLRTLTAVEVLSHSDWYDISAVNCKNPLLAVPEILLPTYDVLCKKVGCSGSSCGMGTILALSAAVCVPVCTFWPPVTGSIDQNAMCRLVVGRDLDPAVVRAVCVTRSSSGAVPQQAVFSLITVAFTAN